MFGGIFLNSSKNKKYSPKKSTSGKYKWVVTILIWTIIISASVSFFSDLLLRSVNILVAFIMLIIIILIGIFFDMIGVAVTAADEVPFHSMASKKIPGAKIAIKLIRNADKVSNFCNDVIGDVCGIISGSIGALIAARILRTGEHLSMLNAFIGAFIAALTISGKALGKNFAITNSNTIIYDVSKFIYIFKKER